MPRWVRCHYLCQDKMERSDREVKTKIKFDRNETEKEIEKFGSFLKSFIPGNVCLFV